MDCLCCRSTSSPSRRDTRGVTVPAFSGVFVAMALGTSTQDIYSRTGFAHRVCRSVGGPAMTERLPARVFVHAIPGGLLLITLSWMIGHIHVVPSSAADFLRYAPYFLFAVGLLLSAGFHRSRIFHALLLLLACESALVLSAGRLNWAGNVTLVTLIGLLLPLNLVAVSFLPESGIFSNRGRFRLGVLAIESIAVAVMTRFYSWRMLPFLERPFLHRLRLQSFHGLPQPVLLSFAICSLALMLQLLRRRFRPVDIGLYWALISSFVALCVAYSTRLVSLAFATGAFVLVIALLEAFYAMAYFDELTDLPGRRSFNDAKLSLGNTYTVAMVDVDHFKKFNDTFGHDAGDQVLRMVASKLAEVSGGGKGFRYGGEEFAVLFPGKQVDETFPHLERLRRNIEELPFKLRSQDRRKGKKHRMSVRRRSKEQTNVTVSIGVAGVQGERNSPDDLVKAADIALYRAKACGRNCTMLSEINVAASSSS